MILSVSIFILLSILSTAPRHVSAQVPFVVCRGDEITITVTLLQNGTFGDPVADQEIEIFDQTYNDLLGLTETDSSGTCELAWQIPIDHQLGITTINATFRGNSSLFLAPSSVTTDLHIVSATEIQVSHSYVTAASGDAIEILARLVDDEGLPVPDETVLIQVDNQTIASCMTNISGYANFLVSCNKSWLVLGENKVTLAYEWNPVLHLAGCTDEVTINLIEIETTISEAGAVPTAALLDSSIEYLLTLSSLEGPVSNSVVRVMLDGSQIGEVLTNHQGNISVHLEVDTRFTLGSHTIGFRYDGSDRYSPSQIHFPLVVTSSAHISVQIPTEILLNTVAVFQVNVTDSLGRAIEGISLRLNDTVSGLTTTESLPSGVESFTIGIPIEGTVGNRTMLFQALGTAFVEESVLQIVIRVWLRPSFVLDFTSILGFSSPGQNVAVEIRLTDHVTNLTNRVVLTQMDDEPQDALVTDARGVLCLSFQAPEAEGVHRLHFRFLENLTRYELGTEYNFTFTVARAIPIVVVLEEYEVISPLKQIRARVCILGLNGSLIGGVDVHFSWFSFTIDSTSSEIGRIVLHLSLPNHDGVFFLVYSIDSTGTIAESDGALPISVTGAELAAAEGLGIPTILFALMVSVIVVAVPSAARRFAV